MRYPFFIAFLSINFFFIKGYAQTIVSGGIYSDTHWTKDKSPYKIISKVVVFDGASLYIHAGVEVIVSKDVTIEIRGDIKAEGTWAEKIIIKGDTSNHCQNFWKGIIFIGTQGQLGYGNQGNFNYCNISDASTLFDFDIAYHGPYIIKNCGLSYNHQVHEDGGWGGVFFDNCTISHNYTGISSFQFGGSTKNCIIEYNDIGVYGGDSIINCIVRNNTSVGINSADYINHCEISNNPVGVRNWFIGDAFFENNNIHDNVVGLIVDEYFPGHQVSNNIFCNNIDYNIVSTTFNNASFPNCCWCSTDENFIRSKIYDGYNDISLGLVNFLPFKDSCNTNEDGQSIQQVLCYPNPLKMGQELFIKSANTNFSFYMFDTYGRKILLNVQYLNSVYTLIPQINGIGIYYLSAYDFIKQKSNTFVILVN